VSAIPSRVLRLHHQATPQRSDARPTAGRLVALVLAVVWSSPVDHWTIVCTGGARIRIPLFCRGWITPVLGVYRYSDLSHFEAAAAVHTISEGFRLEFPSA
jgi:hypothetical protein